METTTSDNRAKFSFNSCQLEAKCKKSAKVNAQITIIYKKDLGLCLRPKIFFKPRKNSALSQCSTAATVFVIRTCMIYIHQPFPEKSIVVREKWAFDFFV